MMRSPSLKFFSPITSTIFIRSDTCNKTTRYQELTATKVPAQHASEESDLKPQQQNSFIASLIPMTVFLTGTLPLVT